MVEFALAATIFLTIVSAFIDVSRAVFYQSALTNAVEDTARYAVVHGSGSSSPIGPTDGAYKAGPPSTDANLTTIAKQHASGLDGSKMMVTSSWPDGNNDANSQVTVAATYPFRPFTGLINFTITLSASSTQHIVH